MIEKDVAVIGGGPAGMASALKASEDADVILLERNEELGGILPQCIHDGFGNFIFKKSLTGPEYAQHFIDKIKEREIDVRTDTTVLSIDKNKKIVASNPNGIFEIKAKAIILAMGCRERTRNQILIPGTRPAGIYTAGTAQRLINIEALLPGKRIVILGSGDIGLIMARRFALEGAEVEGVYEIMPFPGGLIRNVVQCLEDYGIPLYLSHTVINISGRKRLNGVTVARVDKKLKPVKGSERFIPCDCLILAVGLIPENELSKKIGLDIDERTLGVRVDEGMETSVPGIFACGNVIHVHDMVDDVTISAERARESALKYIRNIRKKYAQKEYTQNEEIKVIPGKNVRYIVPQILRRKRFDRITFYFRVVKEKRNVLIKISDENDIIFERRERIVTPPEMVKVEIPSSLIYERNATQLKIDVEREDE